MPITVLGIGAEITPPMTNRRNIQQAMKIARQIVKSEVFFKAYPLICISDILF